MSNKSSVPPNPTPSTKPRHDETPVEDVCQAIIVQAQRIFHGIEGHLFKTVITYDTAEVGVAIVYLLDPWTHHKVTLFEGPTVGLSQLEPFERLLAILEREPKRPADWRQQEFYRRLQFYHNKLVEDMNADSLLFLSPPANPQPDLPHTSSAPASHKHFPPPTFPPHPSPAPIQVSGHHNTRSAGFDSARHTPQSTQEHSNTGQGRDLTHGGKERGKFNERNRSRSPQRPRDETRSDRRRTRDNSPQQPSNDQRQPSTSESQPRDRSPALGQPEDAKSSNPPTSGSLPPHTAHTEQELQP